MLYFILVCNHYGFTDKILIEAFYTNNKPVDLYHAPAVLKDVKVKGEFL
jgi:hypothetical protein